MALFRIYQGDSSRLPTEMHEGWAYVTLDKPAMYVDLIKRDADGNAVTGAALERIKLYDYIKSDVEQGEALKLAYYTSDNVIGEASKIYTNGVNLGVGLTSSSGLANYAFQVNGTSKLGGTTTITGATTIQNIVRTYYDIVIQDSDTESTATKKLTVKNANGEIGFTVASNRGVYDQTLNQWLINTTQAGDHTYIPLWKSKGSATQPVYFNGAGEPAPTTYSLSATINAGTSTTKLAYYSGANAVSEYTSTVGGGAKPIYMNAGVPTACSSTVGSTQHAVYMNAGTITACAYPVSGGWFKGIPEIATSDGSMAIGRFINFHPTNAATATSVQLDAGTSTAARTFTFGTAGGELVTHTAATAIGSASKPVYVAASGAVTACTYSLSSSVGSGTANRMAYYSGANAVSSATSIYADATVLGVNTTSKPSGVNFYVNGSSSFVNDVKIGGKAYENDSYWQLYKTDVTINNVTSTKGILELKGSTSTHGRITFKNANESSIHHIIAPDEDYDEGLQAEWFHGLPLSTGILVSSRAPAAGSATQPVYVDSAGEVQACTRTISASTSSGTTGKLAYYSNSTTIASYTSTVGSSTKPVYINAGVPTACDLSSLTSGYVLKSGDTMTGALKITATTASTSTSTGALVVSGGIGAAGNIYGAKVYNAVWNDYAECFPRGEATEAGDIVALDLDSDEEIYVKAIKDTNKAIGVHSDSYGHLIGMDEGDSEEETLEKFIPVGLCGRVMVKVHDDPKKGDYIGPSDIPGIGEVCDNKYEAIGICVDANKIDGKVKIKII